MHIGAATHPAGQPVLPCHVWHDHPKRCDENPVLLPRFCYHQRGIQFYGCTCLLFDIRVIWRTKIRLGT